MIKIMQLDMRNTPEAKASNDAILNDSVIGIEITDPEIALECSLGNIDHCGDDAACDQAASWEIPKELIIAISKPDCDTFATAAVLAARWKECKNSLTHDSAVGRWVCLIGLPQTFKQERIDLISRIDRFAKDPVWNPQELPTRENPWPGNGGVESSRELAPLQAMCSDFKVPLKDRVNMMDNWLKGGDLIGWASKYQPQVEKERQELIEALANGGVKTWCRAWIDPCCRNPFTCQNCPEYYKEGLVVVETTHRGATLVGYCLGSTVIAVNDEFQPRPDQSPYRKLTICTWDARYADIQAVCRELAVLEPGWGSHQPNICGSPQGKSSELSLETIIEVVQHHLIESPAIVLETIAGLRV